MIAFHGEEGLKEIYLARVRMHREADRLIQGTGWEGGRGCAVGCTLENYNHAQYEIELGIPQVLARLEDRIFEGLPKTDAMLWPERFLDAITPGADLSQVWPQFAVWLLADPENGVIQFAKTDEQRAAIENVAQLYRDKTPIGDPKWRAARQRAYADAAAAYGAYTAGAGAAAAYAAYAAAAAYAAYAAYAADAYADAAAYGADAYGADAAAARKIHWKVCADKLEELLRAA